MNTNKSTSIRGGDSRVSRSVHAASLPVSFHSAASDDGRRVGDLFRRVVRSSCASRRRISTGVYGGGVIRARDGADSGAGAARRRASREIFAGRRGERSRPLRPLQGVDDLALRRAAVLREQALLAPAPDVLAGFRHGHRDRVLVHAVRHHLRARVDALDGGLGRVELLLPAVSVLRVRGERGGGEETARENERRRAPGGCRGASDLRR